MKFGFLISSYLITFCSLNDDIRNFPPTNKSSSGVIVAQEEATSQTLEHDINKHYEEESEDWWEVYRSYKYETTDNLGDLFRVEAQVINKQHAELHDLQKAGTIQHQDDDLVDVKQYQRIHVFQYSVRGMLIDEYEEERLAINWKSIYLINGNILANTKIVNLMNWVLKFCTHNII
ncbi:unnamed protein product [Rhizophagus irregularis]|uniref:Uncharacterized protein n=1 Tax=Rhizophagus irregularis TaxID=588596 RepID=A0A915YPE4_9GLOM|nr:unnamed protein product [Rhizophagus irregularis]CAB5167111.1 unnamed protein product [Rhizophagus irregularis]CAB5301330.1 unnamed protein product [Rhizophagus irregularis]